MSDDFVTYLRALAEKHPWTVRSAARMRQPLDGADAQALEAALYATERERDEARAEVERLRNEADRTRKALGGWALVPPDGGADPTHERVAAVVAEVEKLRAARDTLLLDAADFLRWFDRHYPDPSSNPDHPWCVINDRLNAHADTIRALDLGVETKEAKP